MINSLVSYNTFLTISHIGYYGNTEKGLYFVDIKILLWFRFLQNTQTSKDSFQLVVLWCPVKVGQSFCRFVVSGTGILHENTIFGILLSVLESIIFLFRLTACHLKVCLLVVIELSGMLHWLWNSLLEANVWWTRRARNILVHCYFLWYL